MSEPLSAEHLERLAARGRIFGKEPGYRTKQCSGELYLFESVGAQPPPDRIAAALDYYCPMSLLVDFARAEIPIPETIPRRAYLYKGLPPEVEEELSPQYLPPSRRVDRFDIIRRGWGRDSVVAVFSRLDATNLFGHLRESSCCPDSESKDDSDLEARENATTDPSGPSVICLSMPSVLWSILANWEAERLKALMEGIDALMFEGAGGTGWVMCSGANLGTMLEQLGFREVSS